MISLLQMLEAEEGKSIWWKRFEIPQSSGYKLWRNWSKVQCSVVWKIKLSGCPSLSWVPFKKELLEASGYFNLVPCMGKLLLKNSRVPLTCTTDHSRDASHSSAFYHLRNICGKELCPHQEPGVGQQEPQALELLQGKSSTLKNWSPLYRKNYVQMSLLVCHNSSFRTSLGTCFASLKIRCDYF